MSKLKASNNISPRLQQIAQTARAYPDRAFTSLHHHIDVDLLRVAYRRLHKSGAAGIDGTTVDEYGQDLEANLVSLLERFKSGLYRAPAVRRVYIPKGAHGTRPIGIPTVEDKILQKGVAMVLESIYEQDFLDCSYGFRPGRSAHQMLEALWQRLMRMGGGWVLDVDIQSFFDSLDHGKLREALDLRIRDGVIRRAIGKWLKAGVMEDGNVRRATTGTPQGGVISPLLANVFLHEVVDKWFEQDVKPILIGRGFMLRYADDVVMVFSSEADATHVQELLAQRVAAFGLHLHPDKTRLVSFRPGPRQLTRGCGGRRPSTFDVLGFTHYWDRSRRGRWTVKRKTAAARLRRTLLATNQWLRKIRHWRVEAQHAAICRRLRGWMQYHGITGNWAALAEVRYWVGRIWRKWLDRRSQRGRMTWERYNGLLARYPLPRPRIYHSYLRVRSESAC